MSRNTLKALVPLAIILAVAIAAVVFLGTDNEENTGGPTELPAAESDQGGVSTEPSSDEATEAAESDVGVVDASVTPEDPVPDPLVRVLFDLIEAEGVSPLMEEQYTVEFGDTTDKVRIEGEFDDGPHEFEFEFEDGEWKVSEQS